MRKYTVIAWNRLSPSTRYRGRSLMRALYELILARRQGYRRVIVEVE